MTKNFEIIGIKIQNSGIIGVGYWSMNGLYISIGPKKAISLDLYLSHTDLSH